MDSLGQRILQGLNYSVIGMSITISSLIILSLLIVLMSKIVKMFSDKPPAAAQGGGDGTKQLAAATQAQPVAGTPPQSSAPKAAEASGAVGAGVATGELIAVITAAIAQLTGAAASSFRVVSFKKTGQSVPVWNIQGRNDYLSGKI
ncbi:MAG: OadG family protein [Oscillospiraceae bacterium]|nr:OadG family protein [Oscillospiraceae bacterium]